MKNGFLRHHPVRQAKGLDQSASAYRFLDQAMAFVPHGQHPAKRLDRFNGVPLLSCCSEDFFSSAQTLRELTKHFLFFNGDCREGVAFRFDEKLLFTAQNLQRSFLNIRKFT